VRAIITFFISVQQRVIVIFFNHCSMWTNYNNGVRDYCGHLLPDGLLKNQKLDNIKLTPTTKDDVHDELISAKEVVSSGRMTQAEWDTCADYSHKLFSFGQSKALEKGLILVDTKYEFGKDAAGNIMLIDEIQTPDSSRYWIADSYDARMVLGQVLLYFWTDGQLFPLHSTI
jgi:phosphoribosylaminoimidazole-succinocarboxamide synthase